MTTEILEGLLHESESSSLDFKQARYPFAGASDEDKSELLKDVLAFANAFRRCEAHIIIGVQEVKGQRGCVLGVDVHLDDAHIQQFVNSKIQRPISFQVSALTVDQVQVEVISIPVQKRPFYLKKDYGKLKAGVVYMRRGSSTTEANPDEVAEMGSLNAESIAQPVPSAFFVPSSTQSGLVPQRQLLRKLSLRAKHFDPCILAARQIGLPPSSNSTDESLARFRKICSGLESTCSFGVAITNSGTVTAINLHICIDVPKNLGLFVMKSDAFSEPTLGDIIKSLKDDSLEAGQNGWRIKLRSERILPDYTFFPVERFLFAANKSGCWTLNTTIYADNLRAPVKETLAVEFQVQG